MSTINNHTPDSGYVALLSTIIISAILLVMTLEAGQSGFYTRFMVLGSEAKEQSRMLATSCSAQALGMVLADREWTGAATTTEVASGSCYVFPVQKNYPASNQMTLRVRSVVRNSVTSLVLVYDMGEILQSGTPLPPPGLAPVIPAVVIPELQSWQEVVVMP